MFELLSRLFLNKKKRRDIVYETKVIDGPRFDGSYTAQLFSDGRPYGLIEVGSISRLIDLSK